jgi:hypothetical protein
MSGSLTNAGENWALDIITGRAAQASAITPYLALFTVAPDEVGAGTEVAATGYARVAITGTGGFNANAANGQIANTHAVNFATMTTAAGYICGVGIMSAISGGTCYAYAGINGQIHAANDPVSFPIASIVIRLGGALGKGAIAATGCGSNLLLNLLLRGATLASALTTSMALFTVMPDSYNSGGTEVSGGGYARQRVDVAGSAPDTFATAAANGQIANTAAVTFTNTAAIANIAGAALYDDSTVGSDNLLCFCQIPSRPYAANEPCTFPAGSIILGGE